MESEQQSILYIADEWWENVFLNTGEPHWHQYAEGYRAAADWAVDGVAQDRVNPITTVFGIMHLYRHYLELRLKGLWADCAELLGAPGNPPIGHGLAKLWTDLKPRLVQVSAVTDPTELAGVERLIAEFESLDPGSTAFRYPLDRAGMASLPFGQLINLRHVRAVMQEVGSVLDSAAHELGEQRQFEEQIEEDEELLHCSQ